MNSKQGMNNNNSDLQKQYASNNNDPYNKKASPVQSMSILNKSSTLSDPDTTLDPNKISDYIQLLQDYQKNSIKEGNFKQAELATKRIEELQQHELFYRSLAVVQKNQEELNELQKLNLQQFNQFNEIWDQIIDEHVQHLKQLEENLIEQHRNEKDEFQKEIENQVIPKCKFSKEILNLRYVLENMIQTQKYGQAHEIKIQIQNMEQTQEEKWNTIHRDKFEKQRKLLQVKLKNEVEALKTKLENSLQQKIKIRTAQLQKLLQKFQNMKNELQVKQNQELSQLHMMNNQALTKLNTQRNNGYSNQSNSSVYSNSTLDISKINQ